MYTENSKKHLKGGITTEKLYLGVAQEIITPKVGANLYGYFPDIVSTGVLDDLVLTAYYFKQGDTQALMLSTTLCELATDLSDDLRTLLAEKCNVPFDNIQLSATHTHTGPNTKGSPGWGDRNTDYCENILAPAMLRATENAMKATQPVRMGYAVGESKVGVNRRQLTMQNEVILGQAPWGPMDLKMTVISFVNEENVPVANMVHYGCHNTSLGYVTTEISRDWSGMMTDTLAEKSGAPTAFFCGPEGDTGPRLSNGKTTGNKELMYELGKQAAEDVLRIYGTIDGFTVPQLSVFCGKLALPLDKRMSKAEAEAVYEEYKEYTRNVKGLIKAHALKVLDAIEAGLPEQKELVFDQPIVRLGDCIFVGSTYELYCEIGLRVQQCFKDHHVMMVINTNGSTAYLPTEDSLVRGGYEVQMFMYKDVQPYRAHTDFTYITQTVENVQKILEA